MSRATRTDFARVGLTRTVPAVNFYSLAGVTGKGVKHMLRALTCLALIMAVLATTALASVEVRSVGDVRIYGIFFQNRNFTSWNATGTATEDTLQIFQRFRIRTDFTANEA
jgi:hypothetical protein